MRIFVTNVCLDGPTPILFGVKCDEATVAVRVTRMPYELFIEPSCTMTEAGVRDWFTTRIRPAVERNGRYSAYHVPAMHVVEKTKLVGFQPATWVVKIIYDSQEGLRRDAAEIRLRFRCKTHHHSLDPLLVYTATSGVKCFSWVTCACYKAAATNRVTRCDEEFVANYKHIQPFHDAEGQEPPPPHLRIASFDIETDGLRWDDGDELRMIGVSSPSRHILLSRHPLPPQSSPRTYCVIECGDDESTLIKAFVATLQELKPIFLTGWNIFGFDLQFVFERAKALGVFGEIEKLSWLATRRIEPRVKEMSSSAFGQNKVFHDDIQGLITLDGYLLARKTLKLPSYSLRALGEWVGSAKGDVTYEEMREAFSTRDPHLLERVAEYCIQDSSLVLTILTRMEEPERVMAMTRLTSVPPVYTIKRGQSILTYGLIVSEAFQRKLIINPVPTANAKTDHDGDEEGYQGATVIEPIKGYHRDPVAVLDFESLYPSIMLAYNMCVSTMIFSPSVEEEAGMQFPQYSVVEIGDGTKACFRRDQGRGVVPSILETLLKRRKAVKASLPTLSAGSVEYSQANAQQLALKVACNSVYGYFGASTSHLFVKQLAAAVTAVGRQSLVKVQRVIQDLSTTGKVPSTTHVVYGDSVTGDTALLVRFKDGTTVLRTIESLEGLWQPFHGDKEAFVPSPPLEVWGDEGFTVIRRVIRHVTTKPLLRVITREGVVDCTADHSLVRPDGEVVSPLALRMGDTLLRSPSPRVSIGSGTEVATLTREVAFEMGIYDQPVSDDLLNAPLEVVAAYWEGFSGGNTRMAAGGKLQAAGLYVLGQRLGFSTLLSCDSNDTFYLEIVAHDHDNDGGVSRGAGTRLVGVLPLPPLTQGQFVYDLETSSHHFGVGPGSLVVHNTDSVMVKFPGLNADEATKLAHCIETSCTEAFPRPMRLEFENLFCTYLLENKKRYAGRIHGPGGKTVIKGLSTQRRDFPSVVQLGLQGVLDRLLDGGENSVDLALRHVESVLSELATNAVPWEALCITKELQKHEYKTPPPHLVVAQKMRKRNPQDPPKTGDRISFVVLHGKGNVSDRAEDFHVARSLSPHDTNPDLVYYIEQLCSQCQHLMDLCDRHTTFENLRQKYVIMARLLCEKQSKLSTFFKPAPLVQAGKHKRIGNGDDVSKSVEKRKRQSSLNSFFAKK